MGRGLNASGDMKAESLAQLDGVILEASTGLFESLGVPVKVTVSTPPPAVREAELACSIAFTSTSVSGKLLVLSDQISIGRCLPPELRAGAPIELATAWIGELSNQLLGRIKNRLLPYGVTFAVGTPAIIHSLRLSPESPCLSLVRQALISGGRTQLSVLLEAVFLEAESSNESGIHDGAREAYREGEGTLF